MKIYNSEVKENFNDMDGIEKLKCLLGGYSNCATWFGCDIRCSAIKPSDDEILPILRLMCKYNLSLKDYMNLYVTYFQKSFHPYKGEYGPFITDLEPSFLQFRSK